METANIAQTAIPVKKDEPVMNHHYPAIDGLRRFAAMFVFVFHIVHYDPNHTELSKQLQTITGLGWTGVDLFFVLSGFLITQILLNTKSGPHYFKKFYVRRTLRIFPLYYTVVILTFVILPLFFGSYPPHNSEWTWPYFFTYTSDFSGWNGPRDLNQCWSLAIEEQFYLIWPLAIYLCSSRILAKLFPIGIIASAVIRWLIISAFHSIISGGIPILMIPIAHADGLLMGGWIAYLLYGGWKVKLPSVPIQILVGLFFAGFCSILMFGLFGVSSPALSDWNGIDGAIWLLLINLMYALLLLCAIGPPNFVQKVFSNRVLRWLGKYSYAIYVFQIFMIFKLNSYVNFADVLRSIGIDDPEMANVIYMLVATALTILAALVSWNLLEKPFLSLKKYFPYDKPKTIKMEPSIAAVGNL